MSPDKGSGPPDISHDGQSAIDLRLSANARPQVRHRPYLSSAAPDLALGVLSFFPGPSDFDCASLDLVSDDFLSSPLAFPEDSVLLSGGFSLPDLPASRESFR